MNPYHIGIGMIATLILAALAVIFLGGPHADRTNASLYSAWQKLHPEATITLQEFMLLRKHGLLRH